MKNTKKIEQNEIEPATAWIIIVGLFFADIIYLMEKPVLNQFITSFFK